MKNGIMVYRNTCLECANAERRTKKNPVSVTSRSCTKCSEIKEASQFYTDPRNSDGLMAWCKPCHNTHMHTKYHSNLDESQAKNREWKNRAYAAAPEKHKVKSKQWREQNPEKAKESAKKYKQDNRGYYTAKQMERKAGQLKRTPAWLSDSDFEAMEKLYEECPDDHHIDHEIPLQGRNVSGLHVPSNLQPLEASKNIVKRNGFQTYQVYTDLSTGRQTTILIDDECVDF